MGNAGGNKIRPPHPSKPHEIILEDKSSAIISLRCFSNTNIPRSDTNIKLNENSNESVSYVRMCGSGEHREYAVRPKFESNFVGNLTFLAGERAR